MKKILLLLLLAAMPTALFAQKNTFDKFEDKEGVEVITISKKMIDLAGEFKMELEDGDADMLKKITEKIDELKIYIAKASDSKSDIKKEVKSYLKKNDLEALMTVKKDGQNIQVYAKQPDAKTIEELIVFIEGTNDKESVLVTFTGLVQL